MHSRIKKNLSRSLRQKKTESTRYQLIDSDFKSDLALNYNHHTPERERSSHQERNNMLNMMDNLQKDKKMKVGPQNRIHPQLEGEQSHSVDLRVNFEPVVGHAAQPPSFSDGEDSSQTPSDVYSGEDKEEKKSHTSKDGLIMEIHRKRNSSREKSSVREYKLVKGATPSSPEKVKKAFSDVMTVTTQATASSGRDSALTGTEAGYEKTHPISTDTQKGILKPSDVKASAKTTAEANLNHPEDTKKDTKTAVINNIQKPADAHKTAYRGDIDGLRAIAVIGVVLFHLKKDYLPGGFVGVDIFFVISGYVVYGSLMARKSSAKTSDNNSFLEYLAEFYSRRMKRLMPALTLCLIASTLATFFCVPKEDPRMSYNYESLQVGIAGGANVYYAFVDPPPRPTMSLNLLSSDETDANNFVKKRAVAGESAAAKPTEEDSTKEDTTVTRNGVAGADAGRAAFYFGGDENEAIDHNSAEAAAIRNAGGYVPLVGGNFGKHLWSLGVEEQFYFVFPVLVRLLTSGFGNKQTSRAFDRDSNKSSGLKSYLLSVRVPICFTLIFAASLALSAYWSTEEPNFAFMLMPSRFWQLLLGALLQHMPFFHRRNDSEKTGEDRKTPLLVLILLDVCGFLLIGHALLYAEPINFPYPNAFTATFGAAIFILAGAVKPRRFQVPFLGNFSLFFGHGSSSSSMPSDESESATEKIKSVEIEFPILNSVLSSSAPVFIGKMSYSLYLWHWFVFILFRWQIETQGLRTSVFLQIVATLISFGFAWLSYQYVETPMRFVKIKRHSVFRMALGSAIMLFALMRVCQHFHEQEREDYLEKMANSSNQTSTDLHEAAKWSAALGAKDAASIADSKKADSKNDSTAVVVADKNKSGGDITKKSNTWTDANGQLMKTVVS